MMRHNIFGLNLKLAREKQGFTQQQLAIKLDVSASTIGMYEQGRRQPDFKTLIKISEKLVVPISNLLGTENKPYIKSIDIYNTINELVKFIKNQDIITFKGENLSGKRINNILCLLELILK